MGTVVLEGIRIARAPSVVELPFREARAELEALRFAGSSPRAMGWWIAFPRAIILMLSTSCWVGLKS